MNAQEWLKSATKQLEAAGLGTARLDCLVLLEDATKKDRSYLLAHPEYELTPGVTKALTQKLQRRSKHEPLAYVRNKTEFYGREFYVDNRVLEPRPESETMIELALEVLGSRLEVIEKPACIVDIGTGSGALAITIKLEVPAARVLATDIDKGCIEVAQKNAKQLGAVVEFYKGNLLEHFHKPEPTTYNLLLANLPYVPNHYQINRAAGAEPRTAIFGGADGLDLYRRLFDQARKLTKPPGYILTESLPFQHKTLQAVAAEANYGLEAVSDFIQCFRAM